MTVEMIIQLPDKQSARTILQALESYKIRLRSSIQRTARHLKTFEQRYGVTTAQFLSKMTAEDLDGGDLEYVEWAGESKLLDGLENELKELENARYKLP